MMGEERGVRRHRYQDQTSDIARLLHLPPEEPKLKRLLRSFLVLLSALVKQIH